MLTEKDAPRLSRISILRADIERIVEETKAELETNKDTKPVVYEIPNSSKFSGWINLIAQTKQVEDELLKPCDQGKGAGVRDAFLHPRGIYAEMLKKPFFG